jgi:hypothetical protein
MYAVPISNAILLLKNAMRLAFPGRLFVLMENADHPYAFGTPRWVCAWTGFQQAIKQAFLLTIRAIFPPLTNFMFATRSLQLMQAYAGP